jgi:hypothetical protein
MALAGVVLALAWGWVQQRLPWQVPWWVDTPAVFGFYGLLLWGLDAYLWRQPNVARLLRVPDLRGPWHGSVRSSTDQFQQEHPITVVITQSWSALRIVMEGASSSSCSTAAHVSEGAGTESFEIVYEYLNTPRSGTSATMHAHRGTAHLRLSSDGTALTGEYYTGRDRQTHGTIELKRGSR